jgi:hypothetical protein
MARLGPKEIMAPVDDEAMMPLTLQFRSGY